MAGRPLKGPSCKGPSKNLDELHQSRPLQGADGGEEGIRTPDTVSGIPDFESGAFSHSATSPVGRMLGTPTRTGRVCSEKEKVN